MSDRIKTLNKLNEFNIEDLPKILEWKIDTSKPECEKEVESWINKLSSGLKHALKEIERLEKEKEDKEKIADDNRKKLSKNNELTEKIIQYQELIEVFEGQEEDSRNREKELIQESSRILLDIKQAEEVSQRSQECLNIILGFFPYLIGDDGSLDSKRLEFYQNAEDKINSLNEKNEELEQSENEWEESFSRLDADIKKIDEILGIISYDADDIKIPNIEKLISYKRSQNDLVIERVEHNKTKSRLEIYQSQIDKLNEEKNAISIDLENIELSSKSQASTLENLRIKNQSLELEKKSVTGRKKALEISSKKIQAEANQQKNLNSELIAGNQNLENQLTELQSTYSKEIEKREAEKEYISNELVKAKDLLEVVETETKSEIERLKSELTSKKEAYSNLQSQFIDKSTKIEELKLNSDNLKELENFLQEQQRFNSELRSEYDELKKKLSDNELLLESASKEKENLSKEINNLNFQLWKQERLIDQSKKKERELKTEIDNREKILKNLKDEFNKSQNHLAELTEKLSNRPETELTLEQIESLQTRPDIKNQQWIDINQQFKILNEELFLTKGELNKAEENICACSEKINSDLELEIKFDSEDESINKLEKVVKKLKELLKKSDGRVEELEKKLKEAKKVISELQKQLIDKENLQEIKEIDVKSLHILLPEKFEDEKDIRDATSYKKLVVVRQGLIKEYFEKNIRQYSESNERLVKQRSILSFFLILSLLITISLISKLILRNQKKKKITH
jgi:chromosome segregation ATPase